MGSRVGFAAKNPVSMFSANHRRYLHNQLRHIAQELDEALRQLDEAEQTRLFSRYCNPPAAPVRALISAHRERIQSSIQHFLEAQDIDHSAGGEIDVSWAMRTRLLLLANAAAELRPRYVAGYGELEEADARVCRTLSTELGLLLREMADELDGGSAARVLSVSTAGGLLGLVAELVMRYGLYEYRGLLDTLSDTLVGHVEVALIGRVSSGKSSLINALIGQSLLPVGVRPVTAITTRLTYAAEASAHTVALDGSIQAIPLSELPVYLDQDRQGPQQPLRLREVRIGVPAEVLSAGVVLTDTPGLGSLHPQASAHVWDYLPRCDLGVLTLDANATLSPQDLELLRALRDAGSDLRVVLSKADLLDAEALQQQQAYIKATLHEAMSQAVAVDVVSTHPSGRHWLEHWREQCLLPALQQAAARHQQRRKQRIEGLAQRLRVALLNLREDVPAEHRDGSSEAIQSGQLDHLAERIHDIEAVLSGSAAARILETTAQHWVAADEVFEVSTVLCDQASTLADQAVRELLETVQELDPQARQNIPGAPVFTPLKLPVLTSERLRGPQWMRRGEARKKVQQAYAEVLDATFTDYAGHWRGWSRQVLEIVQARALREIRFPQAHGIDRDTLDADLQRLDELLEPPLERLKMNREVAL